MERLTDNDLKTIIARRDKRFDGRFYFGVKTTRIYCRPVCPAKPKRENIVIFKSLSEAEKHGYRPCLRCRPDVAPGSKLFDGTLNTVSRALRYIQNAAGHDLDVEKVASAVGVTDRHLRRLFQEHLGASPVEVMLTQRLHFAKQIMTETAMPVTETAFASGFKSVRRFNEAFKTRFHMTPTHLRQRGGEGESDGLTLRIPIRPPYDWGTVLAYLARHETYGVEHVTNDSYRRFVRQGKGFGVVVVSRCRTRDALTVRFHGIALQSVRPTLTRVKVLFDTDHNPSHIPDVTGIRVPASYDPFETAISILLSQLVSMDHARMRVRKLVARYGDPLGSSEGRPVLAFPTPQDLAADLCEGIGLTRTLAGAVRAFSQAVVDAQIDFQGYADFAQVTQRLRAIKGIGPWTAEMIAMRCLGNPDAFPETDLILKRTRTLEREEAWVASRSYLAHKLWRDHGKDFSKIKGGRR